jgi:LuxR family maltose regulon positive regulatory protein
METNRNPGLPPLSRRHVRRPRLTRPLDQATAQTILFTAPAGYGKTALAAEWLETTPHVAWYRGTTGSADVAAISVGIADTVAHFMPGAGERLRHRVRMGDAPEKIVRSLAELLAEDLAEWPAGGWLVIDDYHLARPSKAADEFVDWLLMLAPIRLLVTTRQRPRWATARRLLQGEILEFAKEQLAMTKAEANEVLSSHPPASIRALVKKAEGWPVLVALQAASRSGPMPQSNVLTTLFRYFAEEIMQGESSAIQRLLAIASLPRTFDADFIRDLTKFKEPDAVLNYLSSKGLIEGGPHEYRLHPLLREFLSSRLRETLLNEDFVAVVNAAITHVHLKGRFEDALDIAFRTDQLDTASSIATEAAPTLLIAGRLETLSSWLVTLGPRVDESPSLALARADLLTRVGHFSEAIAVSEQVGMSAGHSEHVSRAWCLASRAHHLQSNPKRALETSALAKELARTADDVYEAHWRSLCAAKELALPTHDKFLSDFERVAGTSLDARLRVACGRISLGASQGTLTGLWDELMPFLTRMHAVSDPMVALGSLVAFIDLALARADYHSALTLSRQGVKLAQANRIDVALAPCVAGQAQASIGLRRPGLSSALVSELQRLATRQKDPYARLLYRNTAIRLGIMRGSATAEMVDAGCIALIPNARVHVASLVGLTALVRSTSDTPNRALKQSMQAVGIASTGETRAFRDLAHLIVATRREGFSSHARKRGETVLRSLRDAELLDPLVLAYRVYPPILTNFVSDDTAPFVRELLTASGDAAIARQVGINLVHSQTIADKLTPREKEVMNLLAQGFTNAEIADRLVISHSTAKVHVHNILKKSGVRTRVELAVSYRDSLRR